MKKKLEKIAREDGRYNIRAIKFIYEGLDTVKKQTTEPGHVTGQVPVSYTHLTLPTN